VRTVPPAQHDWGPPRDTVAAMQKPIKKPLRLSLRLTKETVKVLADDELAAVVGGITARATGCLCSHPCHTC
jgi:hypothetical protein